MNVGLTRLVKSAYRREPISSFVVTVGAVDAVMGGVGERWSLFAFGIGMIGLAIGLRWWISQRDRPEIETQTPQYYLPPQPPRPPLPSLNSASKKNPPR